MEGMWIGYFKRKQEKLQTSIIGKIMVRDEGIREKRFEKCAE